MTALTDIFFGFNQLTGPSIQVRLVSWHSAV